MPIMPAASSTCSTARSSSNAAARPEAPHHEAPHHEACARDWRRRPAMFRNYLTVGLRALAKNRTYAFINVFGLAIGMAACLMILLFVRYELSFDTWLPGHENSYQLQSW